MLQIHYGDVNVFFSKLQVKNKQKIINNVNIDKPISNFSNYRLMSLLFNTGNVRSLKLLSNNLMRQNAKFIMLLFTQDRYTYIEKKLFHNFIRVVLQMEIFFFVTLFYVVLSYSSITNIRKSSIKQTFQCSFKNFNKLFTLMLKPPRYYN